jgi:hypothetical protein
MSSARPIRLYFQRGHELSWVSPSRPGRAHAVARVRAEVAAATVHRGFLYYLTLGDPAAGSLWRVAASGGRPRRLVSDISAPIGVAVLNGHVYWLDQKAIGRSLLDGAHPQPRFIVPPAEYGGGVGDGLATDGHYLYFSRCMHDAIARVSPDGSDMNLSFIRSRRKSCPQALAADRHHVYWAELLYNNRGGSIGRANLDATNTSPSWLATPNTYHSGPFELAVGGGHIYWTWGGEAGSTAWVGRAELDRHHRVSKFIKADDGIAIS